MHWRHPIQQTQWAILLAVAQLLVGCQLLTPIKIPHALMGQHCDASNNIAQCPPTFRIQGKIGIRSPTQNGSAFYAWSQQADQYDIQLSGILGIGQTHIWGDAQNATINNTQQQQSANSPDELLYALTGWQAPLRLLPYWINGRPQTTTPSTALQYDSYQRLTHLNESDWQVQFFYLDDQIHPNHLILETAKNAATPAQSARITLTINRIDD